MTNLGLIYLATPYSKFGEAVGTDNESGIWLAYYAAANLTAKLLQAGHKVYSPIVHTHPIAIHGNLDPFDLSIWLPFDGMMLEKSDTLMVAMMPGWEASKGVEHEIQFFRERHKAILFLNPKTMEIING